MWERDSCSLFPCIVYQKRMSRSNEFYVNFIRSFSEISSKEHKKGEIVSQLCVIPNGVSKCEQKGQKEISQKNKRTPALPMQPIIITCTTRQVGFLSQAAALPTSAFDSREACACQGKKNKRTPALPMQPIIITCTTRQVGFLSQAAALPTSAFDSREACACQGKIFGIPIT